MRRLSRASKPAGGAATTWVFVPGWKCYRLVAVARIVASSADARDVSCRREPHVEQESHERENPMREKASKTRPQPSADLLKTSQDGKIELTEGELEQVHGGKHVAGVKYEDITTTCT